MGKNRKQASLTNVVQYDSNFNLSIGTSTSSSFNSSGSIIAASGFTGSLSGSVFGLGNTVSFSSSVTSRLTNIETKSASVDISISNINSVTASNIARLSNLETKSSSVDISVSSLNTFSASNYNTSLNSKTGSYATTGSNTFFGTQVFSGSVYIANDLVVQGSSSIQYISASSVSIGTNIVQLNTANPSVRYAGISVQDSGSSAGVTGSILWDSLCNRWIYSNPSTIGYSGGMLMSGPRTSTLGTESPLTCNYIVKSGGGDHLYDSCISELSGSTCIFGSLTTTGTISGTTIYGSNVVCSPVGTFSGCVGIGTISPLTTLTVKSTNDNGYALTRPSDATTYHWRLSTTETGGDAYTVRYNTFNNEMIFSNYASGGTGGNIIFRTGLSSGTETERFRINCNGITTFTCQACIPRITLNSGTSGTIDLGQISNGGIANQIIGGQWSGYAYTGRLSFKVGTWGVNTDYGPTEQMFIEVQGADSKRVNMGLAINGGYVGIGNSAPYHILDITDCIGRGMRLNSGYDQGDLLMITNKLESGRITINNNCPIAAFRICKGGGSASSASYSTISGNMYITFGLRYDGGYNTIQSIIYPFAITSFGQSGPTSFILGTPTCMTGVDNSGGTTSFGITLCGVGDTGATMLVCATNTQKTISGSTSITISIVASRTALLSNELMNLYKL